MILLGRKDNGALGDKSFTVKRPVIEQTRNILLTADVISRTEADPVKWTPENIKTRQKMLADLAIKRWSLKV